MQTITKERGPWQTKATTFHQGKETPIVISVTPGFLRCRVKGTRTYYDLPWGNIFQRAVETHVAAEKSSKRKQRTFRRGSLAI